VTGLPEVLFMACHTGEHFLAFLLVIVGIHKVLDITYSDAVQWQLGLEVLIQRLA